MPLKSSTLQIHCCLAELSLLDMNLPISGYALIRSVPIPNINNGKGRGRGKEGEGRGRVERREKDISVISNMTFHS